MYHFRGSLQTELNILKLLEKDGRIRLVDISNKLNISCELALYKLKKLYSDKVILGTRIQFDLSQLGYFFSVILLQIKNMSENNITKLKRFSKNHPLINSFSISVTKPNYILQIFHKTEEELRETIIQLENEMKEESFEMEILLISEEEEIINSLPFLK
ncbi:MAG: Lrp/AsnC family transcriptional regulator [Candidatus Woesearchaeota archaeon]